MIYFFHPVVGMKSEASTFFCERSASIAEIFNYESISRTALDFGIAIVFSGIWLEAATHLAIVRQYGVENATEYDRRVYEDKLRLLVGRTKSY
jgi:hypothetical protein